MEYITYDFKIRGDERGSLIAIEENADIPFSIKRVYYIFNTQEGVNRGLHAHRTLRQVLVCVNGSCKILLDDGAEKVTVSMDKAFQGLLVDPMIWHEMYDFSVDCVLLALAGDFYDEKDYIRDYGEFSELVKVRVK
ncbi:MAG: dTDP-6-deoxy-3,4-keto-hexulose isomerase [Firmicutes bacterium HGW-Firmicutes-15]|nr:MAG: dTDP-6-deoxy-3,4-keto-hexulose isomerase [Firmicutes bacterium HGW-Firmicutes-15]